MHGHIAFLHQGDKLTTVSASVSHTDYSIGQRVRVNLAGLHPLAGDGYWTLGTIAARYGAPYVVHIDVSLEGQSDFSGITEDRLMLIASRR